MPFCGFCSKFYPLESSDQQRPSEKVFSSECAHCQKANFLKNVNVRCPHCCATFSDCLQQPEYYSGEVEMTCLACQQVFLLHLDNFIHCPNFTFAYEDFLSILSQYDRSALDRLFYALRIRRFADAQAAGQIEFVDKNNGNSMSRQEVYERILRNREICQSFYGLYQSLIR